MDPPIAYVSERRARERFIGKKRLMLRRVNKLAKSEKKEAIAVKKPGKKVKSGKFKPLPPPRTVWVCKRCGRQYLNPLIRCDACNCTKFEKTVLAKPSIL